MQDKWQFSLLTTCLDTSFYMTNTCIITVLYSFVSSFDIEFCSCMSSLGARNQASPTHAAKYYKSCDKTVSQNGPLIDPVFHSQFNCPLLTSLHRRKIQDPAGIWTKTWILVRNSYHQATWTPGRGAEDKLHKQHCLESSAKLQLHSHSLRLNWNFVWALQPLKAQSWHIVLQAVNPSSLVCSPHWHG